MRWCGGDGYKSRRVVSWPELYEEMVMQFGPDELDDPMTALVNLKQTRTVSEHYKIFNQASTNGG